jgi:hypothetical protein
MTWLQTGYKPIQVVMAPLDRRQKLATIRFLKNSMCLAAFMRAAHGAFQKTIFKLWSTSHELTCDAGLEPEHARLRQKSQAHRLGDRNGGPVQA